jgi:hypothetical protein
MNKAQLFCMAAFAAFSLQAQDKPAAPTGTPKIQFEKIAFDFGKISSGLAARHDFIFTNTGDAMLEVTSVRPSCGCTTAGDWSKTVEPGKTGTIPLQFNSAGFGGMVTKTATVTCNDPASPSITLQLSGNVWKEIDVVPQFLALQGNTENVDGAKGVVKIVNNGNFPIGIESIESNNGMFVADIKTNQPGKEFEISVKTMLPVNPAYTHGIITVKTTSTNVPQVQVTAMLMLQPLVAVVPGNINLPPGSSSGAVIHTLAVRNSGTNAAFKVTEVTGSDARISATVKEIEAGKAYDVNVNLPEGFEVKPGQPAEVVIKTSHPQHGELKVPILQPISPMPTIGLPGAVVPAPAAVSHDGHAH